MTRAGVSRVVPLLLGWAEVPLAVSIYGAEEGVRVREPVPGVLVETEAGWLLLDTGYHRAREEGRAAGGPVQASFDGPGEPLLAGLAAVGLQAAGLAAVALSHLHYDHAGGLHLFAGTGVPVYVQRRELDYARTTPAAEAVRHGIHREDTDWPGLDWRLLDGDAPIAPGVTALASYGHTPGHQSFLVDVLAGPGYLFAFDAADLQANLDAELPVGTAVGVHPSTTVAPIRRLKAVAAERGARLLPGHDPQVWPQLLGELAG